MTQKVIKVGNSYAVTIPRSFIDEVGIQVGQVVSTTLNPEARPLTISMNSSVKVSPIMSLTPEFKDWLDTFNAKYKKVLAELAKK